MIKVFVGDNSFEIFRALQQATKTFGGEAERFDGSELELRAIPDLLMGSSLFAEKRLVIISGLSENKAIWPVFGDWLPRISDDIEVVLIEPKLDKRTKTYKDLLKQASLQEFSSWTDRQSITASHWAIDEAARLGYKLDLKSAEELVKRSSVVSDKNNQVLIDQWRLFRAIEKLRDLEIITPAVVAELVEADPIENVFDLFTAALKGNSKKIKQMIDSLSLNQDPYRLFGLLSGQAFHLAVIASTSKSTREVAVELGVHPFTLENLAPYARDLGKSGTRRIVLIFAKTDEDMKSLSVGPWLLIEQALIKISTIV